MPTPAQLKKDSTAKAMEAFGHLFSGSVPENKSKFNFLEWLRSIPSWSQREEKWNPVAWRGTKWFTDRKLPNGTYGVEIWYEVDRNKLGRVTLCPRYAWKRGEMKGCVDGDLVLLLSEKQAIERYGDVFID